MKKVLLLTLLLCSGLAWADESRWIEVVTSKKGKVFYDRKTLKQIPSGFLVWVKHDRYDPYQMRVDCKNRDLNGEPVVPDSEWEVFFDSVCEQTEQNYLAKPGEISPQAAALIRKYTEPVSPQETGPKIKQMHTQLLQSSLTPKQLPKPAIPIIEVKGQQ